MIDDESSLGLTRDPRINQSFPHEESPPYLRRAFRVRLRRLNRLFQGRVNRFHTGIAHPLESNHTRGVDDVVSRRAARAPLDGDGTA